MHRLQASWRLLSLLTVCISLQPRWSWSSQTNTGQFRLFVFPFKVKDLYRKDADKFEGELRRILGESGRYDVITSDELKEIKRDFGLNVRALIPDSLAVPIAKKLGARIILRGDLEQTQRGTIWAGAKMTDIQSGREKDIGSTEISIGTDISVLSKSLADLIFKRADIDKYMNFGMDYLRSNIFDRAIDNFSRVIELDSTIVEAYYYLGNSYLQVPDTAKAIVEYKAAGRIDSTYQKAGFRLANIYLRKNDFDKAIDLYQRLIRLDPKNTYYHLYLGITFQNAGKFDQALEAFEKGRELNPQESRFSEYIGQIHYQRHEYEQAAEAYEKLLELQPDNIDALKLVAACYNQLSNYAKAAEAYERIVAINPSFPSGYEYLGIWYGQLKEYDKAIAALEKGLKYSPEEEKSKIYLSLVDIYQKAGKYRKVIDVGRQALNYKPNKRIYVFLGDAYQAMGEDLEKKNTVESYQKAIDNYKASSSNYQQVVTDKKYGKYAKKNIERNKSLIDRANLIIKKLKLEGG